MSGRIIPVSPRLSYSFNNAATQTATVNLGARAYSIPDGVSGTLLVRVSSGTSMISGSNAKVTVFNSSITQEEPNTIFLTPTSTYLAQVQINASDSFPQLYTSYWTAGAGSMLSVTLTMTNSGSAGASTLLLGVDLVLRDA